MKKFIFIAAFLMSSTASAQGSHIDRFKIYKTDFLASLMKEKAIINNQMSCIETATTRDAIKNCEQQRVTLLDSFKQEREIVRAQIFEDKFYKENSKNTERTPQK